MGDSSFFLVIHTPNSSYVFFNLGEIPQATDTKRMKSDYGKDAGTYISVVIRHNYFVFV